MKKLFYLFAVVSMVFALASCGSSEPNDLPVSQSATATKSAQIIAAAGNTTQAEITFDKSDFAALQKYAKWVKSGTVETSSLISVKDITESDVELTNVKLSLAKNSKVSMNLPNITGNVDFKELDHLNFLQNVVNEVAKSGSSKVVLSYKTTNTITKPVTFAIKVDANFKFK